MLNAMIASTGGPGTWMNPSAAAARVRLCETVNAVTVFTSSQPPPVMMINVSTNSR